jgi:nucleotide-binding universal stress UspA family protein
MSNKPVIVPWDFSELAEDALGHAVMLNKTIKTDIILLHLVKKKTEIDEAVKKLDAFILDFKNQYGAELKYIVKDGSIFSDIHKIIEKENALFAVMGTHGIKGMQKFTGSWALKVIIGSDAPFIVVQEKPQSQEINKIVFPVDFKFSVKEKLYWAELMYKYFKSKFYLCFIDSSDQFFKKKINANMIIAKKFLTDKGVDFEIIHLDGRSIEDESVKYSKEIKADLIMISTTRNISFHDYMLGAAEQKVIANEMKIPVMTINPKKGLTKLTGFN